MSSVFDYLDLIEADLKRPPFGLITDVDGTISPTAPAPQQAVISPLCHHYLSVLCQRLALVAAISGRPVAELENMVGINRMVYIGNHGLERWAEGHSEFPKGAQDYFKMIKAAIKALTPLLSIEGISIQDKGITATIHYRLCRDPQSTEKYILSTLPDSPHTRNLRIIQEKMAIDLLPPVEINKGTATLDLIREYNLRGGIYMGDDLTDIDAFRAIRTTAHDPDFHGFAIGNTGQEVPEGLTAEIDFTLNGLNDVERFLKWMSQTVLELV